MNKKTAKKKLKQMTMEEIYEAKICKKCGSGKVLLLEYADGPEQYDGISEIDCQDCGARIGRWSGKELALGEVEKRYGRA
jgi:DNA-directed RNA polymerase subunit RPC12/RpoP